MKKCECPIETVADMLGKKWVIMILRDMFVGKKRFKEFLAANPSLSNKVLSQKLKEMEEDGLIARKVFDVHDVEYSLTPLGMGLKDVIKEMVKFGKGFCKSPRNYKELMKRFD